MITPRQSEDLRQLRELRAAPGVQTFRKFLIWLTSKQSPFPMFTDGTHPYYVVNRVVNLIDQDPS